MRRGGGRHRLPLSPPRWWSSKHSRAGASPGTGETPPSTAKEACAMAATSAVGRTGDLRLPACLPACLPDGASLQAFMFEARGPLKPRNDRPVPQPALPVAVARSSLTLLTQRKLSVGPFRTLATCRGSSPEMGRWSPRCIRPPSESTVEKGRPPSGRRRPNPSIPPIDTGDFVLSPRGHGIQSSVFRLTDAFPGGVAWWSTPKKSAAHGRGELPSPTILDGGCSLENAVAQEPCLSASTPLF